MNIPAISGIHHLKFPVADLDRALAFYVAAFGARRIPEYDHRDERGAVYAYILSVPNLGTVLELRLSAELAARHTGFDPITLAVDARADLQLWATHLDALGAVGWLLVFEDPDGRRLHLYTREVHGPELPVSQSDEWL